MNRMPVNVDVYLADGCGRCPLGGTPECKVHRWTKELKQLRTLVLDCGLTEEVKWGVPCYTFDNRNILVVSALKDYCSLSFFKGALIEDTKGILDKPGENTQSARLIKFKTVREISDLKPVLKYYIRQAIEVEKNGLKVDLKAKSELIVPVELQQKLDERPALHAAFASLTPGRQRGYILYFTAAKQSKTRESRIEKWSPHILEGRGLHD
jgi:uncharacterized protein YdeI (YjbR/CyaY-like superfamily)